MEARATFGGTQIAGGVLRTFVVAMLVALLVGAAGGYVVRALTVSVPSPTTTGIVTHQPFVVDPAPYSSPATPQQCVLAGTPPNLAC